MEYGSVEPQPEAPVPSPRAAPRRAALVASLLCAGAAVAALAGARPAAAARGALARLAADYGDYEFPDANDDYLYPQDDEFDDMGIDTYESDDQAGISCEKIAYAARRPARVHQHHVRARKPPPLSLARRRRHALARARALARTEPRPHFCTNPTLIPLLPSARARPFERGAAGATTRRASSSRTASTSAAATR